MVEHPCLPADRTVAACTGITQRAAVIIRFGMTVDAVFTGIMERGCRMTVGALRLRMKSNEWKRCQSMIEQNLKVPCNIAVAGSAV